MALEAKICGLKTQETVAAAVHGGARYLGLVFYAPSPRALTTEEAASLSRLIPADRVKVGLFVDAGDDLFQSVLDKVPLDLLQLHGKETPERVADLKARFGVPVMKVIKVAAAEDLATVDPYLTVADRLLFDAKPPPEMKNALPGGNALSFDWRILQGRRWPRPWMLAGGLTAETLAEAGRLTGAPAVDVSSGVETSPGVKHPGLIQAFLAEAAKL